MLRRPQTSMASYSQKADRSSQIGNEQNHQKNCCLSCNKPKFNDQSAFSKMDSSKLNASIPVESKVKTNTQELGSSRLDNTKVLKESNLSNIELEQLKNIITTNMNYYKEKTKVCCSVKPPKHKLILPNKTGSSIYKADYNKKLFDSDLAFRPTQSYKPNFPFDPNTTYKQNYIPHKSQTPKHSKLKYQPLDNAPRFMNTQYRGQYLPWQTKPMEKFLPSNNNFLQSGNFDPRTVYSSDFKGKSGQPIKNPHDYKGSNIFKGFDVPKISHYRNQFYKKPATRQNNYMPKYESNPGMVHPNQYNTEYKKEFIPKEHQHCHYRKQYNDPKAMATMILNL